MTSVQTTGAWPRRVAGSPCQIDGRPVSIGTGAERGEVSLSVYYVCDIANQGRADEIFAEVYAPRLEALKGDGRIASWGWQSHVLGGEYRRLQTMTGDDYAAVTMARLETVRDVSQEHPELGREFAEICHTHTDYLWDILHEAP